MCGFVCGDDVSNRNSWRTESGSEEEKDEAAVRAISAPLVNSRSHSKQKKSSLHLATFDLFTL